MDGQKEDTRRINMHDERSASKIGEDLLDVCKYNAEYHDTVAELRTVAWIEHRVRVERIASHLAQPSLDRRLIRKTIADT